MPLKFIINFGIVLGYAAYQGQGWRLNKFNKLIMSRKIKGKKNYRMYNETLYEVQNVVQIRWVKNRQYCLIKWRGYDEKFNTWEPKDHITFCYNYEAPPEKDDDAEYEEKMPICNPTPHHYQTRGKNKPISQSIKTQEVQEKEDHTELEEQSVGLPISYNLFPIEKPIKEVNKEILEIRRKGGQQNHSLSAFSACKDQLIVRVLQLSSEKSCEGKRCKVETKEGRVIYVDEEVLKTRYPEKVIEYYQEKFKSKGKCD